MDNYLRARDLACEQFLQFDQEQLIRSWQLDHDEQWLYLTLLQLRYRICRATGRVERCCDGSTADFSETLTIFDLLCHKGIHRADGTFSPVNSLPGSSKIGVGTDFHTRQAAVFDRSPERFRAACDTLGGVAVALGDIGYRIPVFHELTVIVKFYHSDDEFPASLTLLWDDNTLQYMHYETTFYAAGLLLRRIAALMDGN